MKKFETVELAMAHIESLNGQLAQKEDALKTSKTLLSEKETALKAATAEVQAHKTAAEEAQTQLGSALQEVATLSEKLDLQEKHGKDGTIVTIKKKNYTLVGNVFIYDGKEHSAKELSQDTKHLEKMLSKGSGALVPLD